jgi:hypothetical protein
MEVLSKKTSELSYLEKQQICDLFLDVFGKTKSVMHFEQQFSNTCLGYSFHSYIVDNGKVVGINSVIPYLYNFMGEKKIFALSVDTMTQKDHRSLPIFVKMARTVYSFAEKNGVCAIYGFPNHISYKIFKKMLKWQDIGELDFYMLPIRISAFTTHSIVLDFVSNAICLCVNALVKRNVIFPGQSALKIEKINDDVFKKQRYSESHTVVKNEYFEYAYKQDVIKGARVVYLIDVAPFCKEALEQAVNQLYVKFKQEADAIIYIGKLNFSPRNIFRVPKKFEPKTVNMAGLVINNNCGITSDFFAMGNWNVNLSNMDVV